MLLKQKQRNLRHNRVRAKIRGTHDRPRFCIFRSNKYIYGQIIDDTTGATIISLRQPKTLKGADNLGKQIAEAAKEKNMERVVLDRGGYRYHGRVKAAADGARKGGLKF